MTFKERLEIEHPEKMFVGECTGCPQKYNYEISSIKNFIIDDGKGGTYCWNRKIPVEKFKIGDKVKLRKGLKIDGIYFNNDKATDGIKFFDSMVFEGEQEIKEILPNGNILLSGNFYSPVMLEKVEEKGSEREMKKEFTIKDLKDKMIIEFRNGERRVFLNNSFCGISSWQSFNEKDYKDNLTHRYDRSLDIVRVYNMKEGILSRMLEEPGELIWEEEEIEISLKNGNMCMLNDGQIFMWLNEEPYTKTYINSIKYDRLQELLDNIEEVRDSKSMYANIDCLFEKFDALPLIWKKKRPINKEDEVAPKVKHMRFSEAISILKKYYNVDIVQIKED